MLGGMPKNWPKFVAPKPIRFINSLGFLWANPCNATTAIYVETLFPAVGNLFLSLVTFGWDDVMRGAFRPKGSVCVFRKKGKAKTRPGFLRRLLSDDPGNAIGKKLGGNNPIKAISDTAGIKHIWIFDNVLQRGLWYVLIYGVTTDFFIDWASGIVEIACPKSDWTWEGAAGGKGTSLAAIQQWHAVFMEKDFTYRLCGGAHGVLIPIVGASGFVTGSTTIKNTFNLPFTYSLRLIENGNTSDPLDEMSVTGVGEGKTASAVVSGRARGGATYWLEHKISQGFGDMQKVYIGGGGGTKF